ncbi:HEAT repeat domain-containing protein [Parachlamydia sp. AcF125]|uniref:HEAT repeat domain-containing protein n=1 Tax=Parachlamydia sp. AcF125 TaxID=2795736 RepID=UPI001BC963EB|nr:HEAT repeat domain-containing protein [Parachlamydia sp. AcF125]MBS4168592.1 hypothetical protein [Parachlamydia sp. AcF125]
MDINASFLLKADRVSDYIPAISTITNLIDLFQKCVVLPFKQKINVSKSHYYAYLKQKSFSRCVVLLLPVIGNILVAIYDFAKSRPHYAGATPVDAQPVPHSTLKYSESISPPKPIRKGIAIDIEASSVAEQSSLGEPDCCEHSLKHDLQTKLVLNTPRASAKNIYLGQNAQLHVHSIVQCKTEPPLSQAELDPQNLVSSLRHYYLSQKTISIFRIKAQQEWELKIPLEEIYVRLGMIENKERKTRDQASNEHSNYIRDERVPTYETIFEPKQEIELEKLFEHESLQKENAKKIYLQGSAGSGKSTLCHYISYRWAKGELWQGIFACLFWIPLRNLTLRKYPEDKDYTPADLIAREYKGKIDRRVIDFCLKDPAFREKTLLVLDGYDELSADAQGNNSLATAFEELKELFPHILITSRPGSCFFKRSCDLELLGFDKEGIDRYIDKFFTQVKAEEKKEKLRHLLKSSSQVLSLARIPMLLILLCCLFHEDPKFFDSKHPITMTAIYERMINRMYQGLLLRRIGQGESKQTKEHILIEENLRQNSKVDKIATAFEGMAYFAMEKGTLYLNKREIGRFSRDNKISPNELTDCGLLRIPEAEEKWYFIHLTFQEFLTASKVANQYLKGERQACRNFVRQYKFEPRYGLVLRMIAGYLSHATSSDRGCEDALQSFFDDLFAAPQDLAVSSELTLIAECFEECENPTLVKQYNGFVELVKDYVKHLCLLNLDFERLLRNKKLFNHPEIVHTLKELLSDPRTRKDVLETLLRFVRTGLSLALEIVGLIAEELKSAKKYSDAREYIASSIAASILEEIAKQGGELSQEAITVLFQLLGEIHYPANGSVASALEAIAKRGSKLSEKVLATLIQAFKEGKSRIKGEAASTLGKIAKQRGALSKKALGALIQALKEDDSWTKVYTTRALEAIAIRGGELPKETLDALIQALKENNGLAKYSVANAIQAIAEQGVEIPKEALDVLIQALKEDDGEAKNSAANVIKAIAKQGGELPKEVLAALTQAFKEGDRATKIYVADAIQAIAKQGGALPKEALAALTQALEEGDNRTKAYVAIALEAIAQQGDELPKEALNALIQALKEDNSTTRFYAANAIIAIGKQRGELSKEVLIILTQALKEGDRETKYSAARVLGAIAKQGAGIPKEVLDALIQALKEGNSTAKICVAEVIQAIAKQGVEIPKEALDALIQALQEKDNQTKASATRVLREMAKQGGKLQREVLAALIQAFKEGNSITSFCAAFALGEMANQRGEFSKEALDALIQALKESDGETKCSAAKVLIEMAEQGGELFKEALTALIQSLKEGDRETKCSAIFFLKEMAGQGAGIPKEVLDAVIQALKEGDIEIKSSACDVLIKIAKQRGELSKEVPAVLSQAFKEGDEETKGCVADVLEEIVTQGGELPEEVLAAFIQALKEGDEETKGRVARILEAIATQGGKLSKEVQAALLQALKEGNSMTKDYAADALGAIAEQGGGELPKEVLAALLQALKEDDMRANFYVVAALKKFDKDALLKMSIEAFPLIIEACFLAKYSFSVKDRRLQISDNRAAYSCKDKLMMLSYKEIRKQLPPQLAIWRKRLDSLSPAEIS